MTYALLLGVLVVLVLSWRLGGGGCAITMALAAFAALAVFASLPAIGAGSGLR